MEVKNYELLEAQARMMRIAEEYRIDNWRKLVRVRDNNNSVWFSLDNRTSFFNLHDWKQHKFALGVVEGKPVFEGDELYCQRGVKYRVGKALCSQELLETFSWNPPKPKTVMVELPIETAEFYRDQYQHLTIAEACRKALQT